MGLKLCSAHAGNITRDELRCTPLQYLIGVLERGNCVRTFNCGRTLQPPMGAQGHTWPDGTCLGSGRSANRNHRIHFGASPSANTSQLLELSDETS